jgi:hypothetical protein
LGPLPQLLAAPLTAVVVGGVGKQPSERFFLTLHVLNFCPCPSRNPNISAAFGGITCAVVGAIANLSIYTTWHTIWPTGNDPDWFAVTVAVVAFVSMRRSSMPVYVMTLFGALAGALMSVIRNV